MRESPITLIFVYGLGMAVVEQRKRVERKNGAGGSEKRGRRGCWCCNLHLSRSYNLFNL